MSLGQRIRQLRQIKGLTQSQLGGPDLTKGFISLLETDRANPSVETLALLSRRLGTSVDALLGQQGHLPAQAAEGLLALAREALRNRAWPRAARLLDSAEYLSESYGLADAAREERLLRGQIALEERRFASAKRLLEQARAACTQAGDRWRLGRVLLQLGWLHIRLRRFPRARALLLQALEALREAKASRDPARAEAFIALGTTLVYEGDYAGARRWYEKAVTSPVVRSDTVLRGRALWGLGLAHRKLGDLDEARDCLLKARDAMEAAEELRDLVRVLQNLGQLFSEDGDGEAALRCLHHAVRVMERLDMRADRATVLTEIGRLHVALGNLEDGKHFARLALEEAGGIGDPIEVAEAQVVLARAHIAAGHRAAAVTLLKEAVATFKARSMTAKLADTAREMGTLLHEQGAYKEAATYLTLALASSKARASTDVFDDPP